MRFYLAANQSKDQGLQFSGRLRDYIRLRGGEAEILTGRKDEYGNYHFAFPTAAEGVVLVIGGDGTLLQCVNDLNLMELSLPVIGIHLGTLGFLTQVEQEEAFAAVDRILAGEYDLEEYPLLSASFTREGETFCQQAFNDVVVGRQGFARVLPLTVNIGGTLAYEARCDGMVVSTALGSTGYNISLGGPIVPPGTPVFLVTPIAPHLPGIRPIIVPWDEEIEIALSGSKGGQLREGLITCDGRSNGVWLEAGDRVTVRKHSRSGTFLRLRGSRDFYAVFREKLLTVNF